MTDTGESLFVFLFYLYLLSTISGSLSGILRLQQTFMHIN